jgi:hypothetical protein
MFVKIGTSTFFQLGKSRRTNVNFTFSACTKTLALARSISALVSSLPLGPLATR